MSKICFASKSKILRLDEIYEYAKSKIAWYSKDVNECLFSQPYIKAKTIGEILNKSSRTTITKYMNELVSARILSPKKDGLEVYYPNDDLIRILERK